MKWLDRYRSGTTRLSLEPVVRELPGLCELCQREFDDEGMPHGDPPRTAGLKIARVVPARINWLMLCRVCYHLQRDCKRCGERLLALECPCCGKVISGPLMFHSECWNAWAMKVCESCNAGATVAVRSMGVEIPEWFSQWRFWCKECAPVEQVLCVKCDKVMDELGRPTDIPPMAREGKRQYQRVFQTCIKCAACET